MLVCIFYNGRKITLKLLLIKEKMKQILVDTIIYVQKVVACWIVKILLEHVSVSHKFISECNRRICNDKKTCYVYFATVYDVWVINIGDILK